MRLIALATPCMAIINLRKGSQKMHIFNVTRLAASTARIYGLGSSNGTA